MKNLKTFEQFKENNVQEGIKDYLLGGLATMGSMVTTPEISYGQQKTPTEDSIQISSEKKDILGRPLTSAPSTKTENLGKRKYLVTTKQINPSPQKDAELKAKGYKPVWTETVKSSSTEEKEEIVIYYQRVNDMMQSHTAYF
jgi:hypothetical protein